MSNYEQGEGSAKATKQQRAWTETLHTRQHIAEPEYTDRLHFQFSCHNVKACGSGLHIQ